MQLRSYQQRAIDDLRNAYRFGYRAPLLCLPTGGGKTIIFTAIAQASAARGRRVLILVHRRELLRQASDKLRWAGLDHGLIAAGIEPSEAPVQVASVQTIARRLSGIDWQPDLIIIDEAHHATAGQWDRILQHWPSAYRLGVTATPCRLDGRGLRSAFDHLVLGPSVAELIDTGYLSHSRIYAPPLVADLSGIRTRAGDYANDQAAAAMDRPTVTGDAIAHYQRLAAGQQAIAFCCNIAHAESVCAAFLAAGITASLLLGTTINRDQVVADFGAGLVQILVTVDVVSEGFDVPAASVAILLRPTKSLGLYLQQVGRVLRPAPGKQAALILDHVGNVTRHGFPDDHRDWTLDDGIRRTAGTAAPSVRTCPECYAAFKPAPVCPCCGAACAPTRRELQQVEGQLQELKRKTHQFKVGMKVGYASEPPAGRRVGPYMVEAVESIPTEPNVIGLIDSSGEYHLEMAPLLCPWPSGSLRSRRGRARTLPQLLALAKERGYSPGWAYRIFHARGKR
jgi:superfamily II DNA or RNA helicase